MKPKKQKDLAQRIDPTYHRRWHALRRARFFTSLACFGVAALWVAGSFAAGDETVFSNGPLSRSHAYLEEDCAACHVGTFSAVPDATCRDCHEAGAHVPPEKGEDPACTSCHVEHRGRERLVEVGTGRCNACHEEHQGTLSFRDHVRFKRLEHDQHLRFSHAKHLAPDLLEGPLDCAGCHVPDATGRHFVAIDFDAHCARCHTEALDPDVPEAVPHGLQPERLRAWIAGAYLERMRAAGGPDGPVSPVPGRGAGRAPAWSDALAERTGRAFESLLRRDRGCLFCHVLEEGRIVPPSVPTNWYPKARFDHEAHRFEDCAACHDMSGNEKAETLDLPNVDRCAECHRPDRVADTCATCHPYHPR